MLSSGLRECGAAARHRIRFLLVTRRIRIIAARRRIIGMVIWAICRSGRCPNHGSGSEPSSDETGMRIPTAMPNRGMPANPADSTHVSPSAARGEPIDEQRGRSIGLGETPLENRYLERQLLALELRLFE